MFAQNASRGHSHNDYWQAHPFFTAYQHKLGSVEADIWAIDGELHVAHEKKEIDKNKTLDALYILPIVNLFAQNKGRIWKNSKQSFQLMIDLKDTPYVLLNILAKKLEPYRHIFDKTVNPNAVTVVVSASDTLLNFPESIRFDGRIGKEYTQQEFEKIELLSEDFSNFSAWKGIGMMSRNDLIRLKTIVYDTHQQGKKLRFWNTGDNEIVWKALLNLGVDYIGTDQPEMLARFLKKNSKK